MGFTIEDAFNQTKEQYKLELLAGQNGCANAISWVHLIEDTTIIQQLWGKELAVTTGLGFQSEEALFNFIKKLVKHHSTGLIINTGKYINEIPQNIIDYCNEQDFPLITTPWEIHLADVIKDFSMRCILSEREDQQVSKHFTKAFTNKEYIETCRNELLPYFDVDGDFQVILLNIENSDSFDAIELRRVSFQLQLNIEKIDGKFSFFFFDGSFVLVTNNMSETKIEQLINKMLKRASIKMKEYKLHVGIGSQLPDIKNVVRSYRRAKSAVSAAEIFDKTVISFKDMGIYQILFSIEDQDILTDMYYKQLKILIDYDNKHHTEFERTLYYYIKYNGSPQNIAKAMFTHRNTINYRINKIKQLLNNELQTPEERFPYMLAFYIKQAKKGLQDD